MNKVTTFIKNYKKILLAGLGAILVVVVFTAMSNYFIFKYETSYTNVSQLEKISEKADVLKGKLDTAKELYKKVAEGNLCVVARLLREESGDVYNNELLAKYSKYLSVTDNLIILDSNRKIVNSVGTFSSIDYTKSYYDDLFKSSETEAMILTNEGSKTELSACAKSGNYYVLIQGKFSENYNYNLTEESLWNIAYLSVGLDTHSNIAVINTSNNKVVYSDIDKLIGTKIDSNSVSGNVFTNGDDEYVMQSYEGKDGYKILALTSKGVAIRRSLSGIDMIISIFVLVLLILVAYVVCLRQDEIDPSQEYMKWGKYFLRSQTKRFKGLSIVVVICAFALLIVVLNLNDSRDDVSYIQDETAKCKTTIESLTDAIEETQNQRDDIMYNCARIGGAFIDEHSEYTTKSGLKIVAKDLDVKGITIFAASGSTICTSSDIDHLNVLEDPDSSLYELRYALMGKEGVMTCGDTDIMSDNDYLYAIPRRNSAGEADGMIAIITGGGVSQSVNNAAEGIEINRQKSKTFVVDKTGLIITTISGNEHTGIKKVNKETLQDGYMGHTTIDGQEYLATVTYIDKLDEYMFVVLPVNWITPEILFRSPGSLLLLILFVMWIWYDGLGSKHHFEKRTKKEKDADEWKRTELNWEELSVGKKMGKILSVYIYIFSLVYIVAKVLHHQGIISDYGLGFIVSANWNKTVNGYSILGNVFIICVFYTIVKFIEYLILLIEKTIGDTGATMCRLMSSLVKYLGGVLCLYTVVTNFGVDAATALASIGIAGFALTFGAQELIKDMISGMFIILEGKYKVGDMIEINGDWYWIKSIGVRTTTVEAWGQVRVINNSAMTGIVNIQNASAVVNVDIMIENKHNVDDIKAIIMEDLPKLKEHFPASVSTPSWKGVQDYNGSGTVVRMRTYCPPMDQGWVGREMRKEVKRILDEHGIELANESFVVINESR